MGACNSCPGGSSVSWQSADLTASLAKDGQLHVSLFSIATLQHEVTVLLWARFPHLTKMACSIQWHKAALELA